MSSSADATLLPPPVGFDDDDRDRYDDRGLDDVGPITVLGAMVEQRRASRPDFEALLVEDTSDADDTLKTAPVTDCEDDGDADATQPGPRVPAHSVAFLKAR